MSVEQFIGGTAPAAADITDSTATGQALITAADAEAVRTASGTESTAQLDARDADNRDRDNHTGTQAISTLDGSRSLYNNSAAPLQHINSRLADIAAGSSQHLNVWTLGDSLAGRTASQFYDNHIRKWWPVPDYEVRGPFWNASVGNANSDVTATNMGSVNGGSYVTKTNYDFGFDGASVNLAESGSLRFARSSTTMSATDRILIPYVIAPDAGTFKVEIGSAIAGYTDSANATWTDPSAGEIVSSHALTSGELIVDASGPAGLGVIELEFATNSGRIVQVLHESGGAVDFLRIAFFAEQLPAINEFVMSEASNDWGSTTDASIPRMAALVAAMRPDIITVQTDDSGNAYAAWLPRLKSAIDDAELDYAPLIVLIGEGPKEESARHANVIAANNEQAGFAAANKWYFYDSFNIYSEYSHVDAAGLGGDGLHLSGGFYKLVGDRIAAQLGLDLYPQQAIAAAPTTLNILDGQAEADDWESRVTSNSGTLTADSKAVASALAIEIHRLGLRDKVHYVLPFLGADLNAMEVPLIDDHGVGNATPNALTDTEVDESYGMQKAVGTDHYLDTGIDDAHTTGIDDTWMLYFTGRTEGSPAGLRTNSQETWGWETNMNIHAMSANNAQLFATATYPATAADGLHSITHDGGYMRWYLDGVLQATRSATATPVVNTKSIKLGAMHTFDGSYRETDAAVGFFLHADALTLAEETALASAIQAALIDRLGR